MLDRNKANFAKNAKEFFKVDDGYTVPHNAGYDGLSGNGYMRWPGMVNPGDFTWALHDYWLHYRYSMDQSLITDRSHHAFLRLAARERQRIPAHSQEGRRRSAALAAAVLPEYGMAADNNYNLALLRWACQTLLELCDQYKIQEPLIRALEGSAR